MLESGDKFTGLLDGVRRRLVDTGARNRLIHVSRTNRRANALNIINERSEDIFEILRTSRKKMRFTATGTDEADKDEQDSISLAVKDGGEEEFDEARYQDSFLETPLGPEALQRRLLRLFTDSKTAEEEQGINILYLAMGFLAWYEDRNSNNKREAPLILLPVELVRNERGSTFDIRCREDEISTNLPLQERFKSDFGIILPDIEDTEDWSPNEYFLKVEDAVSEHPRWEVEQDGMQLGFFSFAKLLMLRDLEPENWKEGGLLENDIVQRLLKTGFATEPPLFNGSENLDSHLDPNDIIQVVDADASQTRVIEEVRSGRNLVVQGPPGTGKSQTITNIISSAVHDGKSVLFMAEKMAALNVVHGRLKKEGLSGICLELHSRNANKKAVIQELQRTLASAGAVPDQPQSADDLSRSRDRLNEIADLLHQRLPDRDYSPFTVLAEISNFIGREVQPPKLRSSNFRNFSNRQRDSLAESLNSFLELLKTAGPRQKHPFFGTGALNLQPTDRQRLEQEIQDCEKSLADLENVSYETSSKLVRPNADSISAVEELAELLKHAGKVPESSKSAVSILFGAKDDPSVGETLKNAKLWCEAGKNSSGEFQTAAWTANVTEVRSKISKGAVSFWSRLFGGYRRASMEFATLLKSTLPDAPRERLALVDRLIDLQGLRDRFERDEPKLKLLLGTEWKGESTDFHELGLIFEWIQSIVAQISDSSIETLYGLMAVQDGDALSLKLRELIGEVSRNIKAVSERLKLDHDFASDPNGAGLSAMREYFSNMRTSIGRYPEWVDLDRHARILDSEESGLSELREALETGELEPERAVDEFKYAVAEDRWEHVRSMCPEIVKIDRQDRHRLVETFCELEHRRFDDVCTLIRTRHLEGIPTGAVGEMGFLRGEIGKKRGHRPIRTLIRSTTSILQKIKPVFLMSPISIAQFLPPGSLEFDILVIDEASQVRPEDALGAAARVKQIVVVGDRQQLPPTSFFDRITDDEHEDYQEEGQDTVPETAKVTEMESILTLCEARGVGSSMLEWHYRSRDPSLIRVSNAEFYDNRLKLPPSPVQLHEDYGLTYTYVPGAYSSGSRGKGRTGTNRIEAEHIVDALCKHARECPTYSVGIVAFSKSQSDMITEILEFRRREDQILDSFLRGGKSEEVFVKNIENVQGDERDVILISVGYGPHEPNQGLPSMRFGPVNNEGGEKRLNVLFSRSRIRCQVFASFEPGDMDLSRTKGEGPRVLHRFLDFAKTGQLAESGPGESYGEPDSPFEEDVARVIKSLGYHADHQVGSAGFRIDIGVRRRDKPGVYILAVECDGAAWHSALWARERDRLRQEVLEGLGWRFHRIWSTDWFYRRSDEINRLKEALETAKADSESDFKIKGANEEAPDAETHEPLEEPAIETEIALPQLQVPKYVKSRLDAIFNKEPHEITANEMAQLANEVVSVEGPVHFDVITRRIISAFGKTRAGQRIQNAVRNGLELLRDQNLLVCKGEFWFTPDQKQNPPIRDRSAEDGYMNKAECFSPFEIRAAAELIRKESGNVEEEELVRAISNLFGFQRTGPDLQRVISDAVNFRD